MEVLVVYRSYRAEENQVVWWGNSNSTFSPYTLPYNAEKQSISTILSSEISPRLTTTLVAFEKILFIRRTCCDRSERAASYWDWSNTRCVSPDKAAPWFELKLGQRKVKIEADGKPATVIDELLVFKEARTLRIWDSHIIIVCLAQFLVVQMTFD
jgi:hypothetical protein